MIVGYNHATVTPSACLAGGRIFLDGFGENCVFRGFHPELFGQKPTMPEPQRSETLARLGWVWSNFKYIDILSGASVLYNYEDNGEVVATAFYKLPSAQRAKLSWRRWFYYHVYKLYFKVRVFLFHRKFVQKYFLEPVQLGFLRDMFTFGQTPAQAKDYSMSLATKSYRELVETRYPIKDTLYLDILSVKRDTHGKGYGSKLLNESLSSFKLDGPVFSNGEQETRGPLKASLIPSVGNDTFYARYGFKTVHERYIESCDGRASCDVKFMEKLI